jgi:hypothetical protein
MFRSQSQPCYPEPDQPEGCFPANARTPSPFQCWLAGGSDRLGPRDRAPAAPKRPSPPAPVRRRFRPDR